MIQGADHEMERKRHELTLELQEARHQNQLQSDQVLQKAQQKELHIERKLEAKQERLKVQQKELDKLSSKLLQKKQALLKLQENLHEKQQAVLDEKKRLIQSLESTSNLSQQEAEEKLFKRLTLQVKKDCAVWSFKFLKERKAQVEKEAMRLMVSTLSRLSGPSVHKTALSTVALPQEEIKSRIIGREGRNIQYLENLLGVQLLVDETPKTVLISSYDPLRKAIACETVSQLVLDGRIHPSRIDEEYERAKLVVQNRIRQEAENKCDLLGITQMHSQLIDSLSKMALIDSLGQNLLEHSYEVAQIMSMLAHELGLDAALAARIGLLHDIGKTAPADSEGSHAIIGMRMAKQCGESEWVSNGIGCHHGEVPAKSVEGSLCTTADALSAARPGARSESMHHYFKRIKQLEALANQYPEVERAYALQAGKEIRVITKPNQIDDASLMNFAQNLTRDIEKKMQFAGKIKVSVLRTQEAIEYTR